MSIINKLYNWCFNKKDICVQFNGTKIGSIKFNKDESIYNIETEAKSLLQAENWYTIVKTIYVPDESINFVGRKNGCSGGKPCRTEIIASRDEINEQRALMNLPPLKR